MDKSKQSIRYMVNKSTINMNSSAFKLHCASDKLKRFELLYQNRHYRVFKILDKKISRTAFSQQIKPTKIQKSAINKTSHPRSIARKKEKIYILIYKILKSFLYKYAKY